VLVSYLALRVHSAVADMGIWLRTSLVRKWSQAPFLRFNSDSAMTRLSTGFNLVRLKLIIPFTNPRSLYLTDFKHCPELVLHGIVNHRYCRQKLVGGKSNTGTLTPGRDPSFVTGPRRFRWSWITRWEHSQHDLTIVLTASPERGIIMLAIIHNPWHHKASSRNLSSHWPYMC